MKKLLSLYYLLWVLLLSACADKKSGPDFDLLAQQYTRHPEDSLKLRALQFIRENIPYHLSENPVFYNKTTKKVVNVQLDTITSEASLVAIMKQQQLAFDVEVVPDTQLLTTATLDRNISQAVAQWKKYPWNQQVPASIFLNYLLPYKIYGEYPEQWRNYFQITYHAFLKNATTDWADPNKVYHRIIADSAGHWFKYNPSFHQLCTYPSLSELLLFREGECVRAGYFNVNVLRAIGIPATVDLVPLWGSVNGGHATEVFWRGDRMRPADERSLKRPAKVFRLTYQRQPEWTDSLQPLLQGRPFLLGFLKNSHWKDVTAEHTLVSDLLYPLDAGITAPLAYICVYNYGQWRPVYYGKISAGTAYFRNLGRQMLYRVAVPDEKEYRLVSDILMLDSTGALQQRIPGENKHIQMTLANIFRGGGGMIQKDSLYTLLYWQHPSRSWQRLGTRQCTAKGRMVFDGVPAGGYYKLICIGSRDHAERIFTYEKGKQIWW